MRWVLLVLSLSQFAIAWNAAGAERQHREVTIADPYIELHTGPGGGYPIFFVAERGEQIALLMRRTEWFKVRVARGQEGWVHFEQLTTTGHPQTVTDADGGRSATRLTNEPGIDSAPVAR